MRSQEEILARFNERKTRDWTGFEVDEYMGSLDFDHAKSFLRPEITESEWKTETKEETLRRAKDYMSFAIEKAEDERGISANRSIMHYIAWLWLLEEDELLQKVDHEYDTNYCDYGLPILRMISKHFGWN